MKRLLSLLAISVAMTGCHIETEAPKPTSASPVSTNKRPVEGEGEREPVVTTAPKPLKHPDRIYQLEDLQTTKIRLNGAEIDAWIMNDDSKRAEGMMFLKPGEVKDTQGMIFVYNSEQDKSHGFWMQNTYTPLDIIYIGSDKRVISIGKGEPLNTSNVTPTANYQYVLELKQGAAKKFGIKPGVQIDIPPEIMAEG